MVVGLRPVHALGVLPREVAQQAERRQHHHHEVEDGRGEELRNDALVLRTDADHGRDDAVDGEEDEPDGHAAGDGHERVLGPHVGDERGLAQHRRQHRRVDHGAPHPVAGHFAVALHQIVVPDQLEEDVGKEGVVEAVEHPGEEGVHLEKDAFLAELVELRVSIEEAGRDELVEDAHHEGGKDGKEDVVERQSPGLHDDLPGKGILK